MALERRSECPHYPRIAASERQRNHVGACVVRGVPERAAGGERKNDRAISVGAQAIGQTHDQSLGTSQFQLTDNHPHALRWTPGFALDSEGPAGGYDYHAFPPTAVAGVGWVARTTA
jgi:hypothetical protein